MLGKHMHVQHNITTSDSRRLASNVLEIVPIWVPRVCRIRILNSQILMVFGVSDMFLHDSVIYESTMLNHRI
jgi:hypothetical protein